MRTGSGDCHNFSTRGKIRTPPEWPRLGAGQLPKCLHAEVLGTAVGQHAPGTVPLWATHQLSILKYWDGKSLKLIIFQESILFFSQSWSSSPTDPAVWFPAPIYPWNFSCQEGQGAFSRNVIGREDKNHANYISKLFFNHIKVFCKESSGLSGVW